jgi:hypothetical protein
VVLVVPLTPLSLHHRPIPIAFNQLYNLSAPIQHPFKISIVREENPFIILPNYRKKNYS